MNQPKEPWKIDTNAKYSDVMKSILGLATASLMLPVVMSRNFLAIKSTIPLSEVLSCSIYISWIAFGLSIISCVMFQYLSAKWVRIAWGKPAGIFFCKHTSEKRTESLMEGSFWLAVLSFLLGIFLTIYYFLNYSSAT